MKQKGFSVILVLLVLIILVLLGVVVYITVKPSLPTSPSPSISPSPMASTEPTTPPSTTPSPTPDPHASWEIYTNEEYGFQISYPDSYDVLTSADDLYGWPHAVALLYNGGQAYDIVIEAWDSLNEYESSHPDTENFEATVSEVGDKVISVTNYTAEDGNSEVISTFIVLE